MDQSTINKLALAKEVYTRFTTFIGQHLAPLRGRLNQHLHRYTQGLVRMEAGPHALCTSQIATELLGGNHEPAGVKRLDRVLATPHWSAYDLQCALHAQGEARAADLQGDVLIALDPSDLEKPESLQREGLHKVVSPTARHLARPRRGFGGAPLSRLVTVPGLHFLVAVLMGMHGPALLVGYRWWQKHQTQGELTRTILELTHALAVRYQPVHPIFVGDRGVGNRSILPWWVEGGIRFVVRFNEHVSLCAQPDGALVPVKTLCKRQRAMATCPIYDVRSRQIVTVRLVWSTVWLPGQAAP